MSPKEFALLFLSDNIYKNFDCFWYFFKYKTQKTEILKSKWEPALGLELQEHTRKF